MPLFVLLLLSICYILPIGLQEKKRMSSKERLNLIEFLSSQNDQHSNSTKWDLVRQELSYIENQITNNKKFNLSDYLKNNSFMPKLLNLQIAVNKEIDSYLTA